MNAFHSNMNLNELMQTLTDGSSQVKDWLLSNPKATFAGASVAAAGYFIFANGAKSRDEKEIPQMSGFQPIIGHANWVFQHWDTIFDSIAEEYMSYIKNKNNGKPVPFFASMAPNRCIVWVFEPEFAELSWRDKFGDVVRTQSLVEAIKPVLGDGIFTSTGKNHRAIASRMFTMRSLRDYMFKNFVETADKMVIKCEELQDKNGNVDMFDMFSRLTFEAFTNSAFGTDIDAISIAPDNVPFAKAFDESNAMIAQRFMNIPFIWKTMKYFDIGSEKKLRIHCQTMNDLIISIIKQRKEYFANLQKEENARSRNSSDNKNNNNNNNNSSDSKYRRELREKYDLLSLFIRDNPKISDKELRDVTMNFIIAGRDTTSQLLSWFMYEMTRKSNDKNGDKINSGVELKIREEINAVLKKNGGFSYQAVQDMKYLEGALLETLRIHPSVPALVRKSLVDIEYKGYKIRKGDDIIILPRVMGRLPWIWDNPDVFEPERFYNVETKKLIDITKMTGKFPNFNIAPRMCLGKNVALLEAKIAVVKLFEKYKNITIVPNQEITYVPAPTNQMKNGMKLLLQ